MSFKDFLKSCSEETSSADIAMVDTCIPSKPCKVDPEKPKVKKPKKETLMKRQPDTGTQQKV